MKGTIRSLAVFSLLVALVAVPARSHVVTGYHPVCTAGAEDVMRLEDCAGPSAALGISVGVRVLKPPGYSGDGAPHPVLLLLHGCCGNLLTYRAWTTASQGNAQGLPDQHGFLIVMPAGDHHGWYTDWYDDTAAAPHRWETHHLAELLPWVKSHYNVAQDRAGWFVGGLSMGGYGAAHYAARRPDLFRGTASFSGAVNPLLPGADHFIDRVLNTPDTGKVWGDRSSHEIGWRNHDPVELATNLAALDRIYISTGIGAWGPGEIDRTQQGGRPGESDTLFEFGVNRMSHNLSDALTRAEISHELNDYVLGTHIWYYWRLNLRNALDRFSEALAADPSPSVASFSYRTADPSFEIFGWQFAADGARAPEFLDVTGASGGSVTLRGSGTVTVTTAGLFTPFSTVSLAGATAASATADAQGRITFQVSLGAAHTLKQFTNDQKVAEASSVGAYWTARTVTFTP